jgi:hypothetical protein
MELHIAMVLMVALVGMVSITSEQKVKVCVLCFEKSDKRGLEMTTYNRAWLRDQVRSNLHDQGVPEPTIDHFIDMGSLRVGQKLRSSANQVTVDWSIAENMARLPADLVELRTIRYSAAAGQYALRSIASHQVEQWASRSGGQPLFYEMRGDWIAVRPFVAGTYELTYWQNTDIPDDPATEIPALTAYPFLFLNAALEAGYQWKQDEEQRVRMRDQWLGEVREVNATSARRDSGDVPAQRAI